MTNPNAINSTVTNSTAGADAQFNITNTTNTAGADAIELIQVAGGTAGDAYINWSVSGVTNWVAGLDNSDSDSWVLSVSSTPGTSNVLIASTAGAVQVPLNNFTVTRAEIGGSVISRVTNTDNTSVSSTAILSAVSGGGAGGDPVAQFAVTGGQTWTLGIDNSQSDRFSIANSSALGTTDVFLADVSTGQITIPLGDTYIQRAAVGLPVLLEVNNTDNSNTSSAASIVVLSGGSSGGDPSISFQIQGTGNTWSLGTDNSTSDQFSLSYSAALGTNNALVISTSTLDTTCTGNFLVTRTDVGNTISLGATQSDGTNAASHASCALTAATGGGDPRVTFDITGGGSSWTIGADNSAADAFVISQAFGLGSNNVISIATSGAVSVPLGDLSVSRSNVGSFVSSAVTNTDNTNAASGAQFVATVGGSSAGDPQVQYVVSGAQTWTEGVDNSASDAFVIAASSALGTTNVVSMSTAGLTTFPTGNVTLTRSDAGNQAQISCINSDNSNSSTTSQFLVRVGGGSAGDPTVQWIVGGNTTFTAGLDNSVSDNWVLAASATLGTTNVLSITTGGAVTVPLGNVSVSRSAAGADVSVTSNNSDNTSGTSNAYFYAQAGGASGGDAFYRYGNGVTSYAHGVDNSDSDAWCLTAATTLNGTNIIRTGTEGNITLPLTTAFMAYQASDQTNATGNGTAYTLGSTTDLTEVFDQSSAFNPATGTFTAPSTLTTVGKFSLNAGVYITACTIATTFALSIITSNRTYTKTFIKAAGNQSESISLTVFADMDASDTATVTITVSGEAGDTCTVAGSSTVTTFFSGKLEC